MGGLFFTPNVDTTRLYPPLDVDQKLEKMC